MKLTVFTPTYNRAHLLPRLYDSLCKQQSNDFEWLIVDDGSSDDTESVVHRMVSEQKININYIKKSNGGKHTAHNTALYHAVGEWFLCLDSDDIMADHAIQHILAGVDAVRPSDCGLIALKALENGRKLSGDLPVSPLSSQNMYYYSVSLGGEFVFIFRTELIRKYPYPVVTSERFSGESILYDRLDLDGHTILPLNQVLEICEYQPDGLSNQFYKLLTRNPTGFQIYHAQRIDLVHTLKLRFRHAICYQAFRRLSGNNDYLYRGKHQFLSALAWLPGQFGALYYKKKGTC